MGGSLVALPVDVLTLALISRGSRMTHTITFWGTHVSECSEINSTVKSFRKGS